MLELKHIHKYYNPGTVNEMCLFEDFNLSVKQGDFVSVVGSNGSGKDFHAQYPVRKHSGRSRADSDAWGRHFPYERV